MNLLRTRASLRPGPNADASLVPKGGGFLFHLALKKTLSGVEEGSVVVADSLRSLKGKLHSDAVGQNANAVTSALKKVHEPPNPPPLPPVLPKGWSAYKAKDLAKATTESAAESASKETTTDLVKTAPESKISKKFREIAGEVLQKLIVAGMVTAVSGTAAYGGEKIYEHEKERHSHSIGHGTSASGTRQGSGNGGAGYTFDQASDYDDRTFCKTTDGVACMTAQSVSHPRPHPVAPVEGFEVEFDDGDAFTGDQKRRIRAALEDPYHNTPYGTKSDRNRFLNLLKFAPGLAPSQLNELVESYRSTPVTAERKKKLRNMVEEEFANEDLNETERDQLLKAIEEAKTTDQPNRN
ncbi:hypothetical protein FRB98_002638 [Tulasnella sp. 332]|nr:hypothetical protein FRB98_002638 [Tulasnella sp. 332]